MGLGIMGKGLGMGSNEETINVEWNHNLGICQCSSKTCNYCGRQLINKEKSIYVEQNYNHPYATYINNVCNCYEHHISN